MAGPPLGWAGGVLRAGRARDAATCASASSPSPTARPSSSRTSWATSRSSASTRSSRRKRRGRSFATSSASARTTPRTCSSACRSASTMGLAGSPVKPMVVPWLLNRNGQAITLNNKLKAAGVQHAPGAQAAGRQGQGRRRPDDLRDDVSHGHPRDVDALLAGLGRHSPGQGREPHHHSAAADGRQHEGRQDGRLLRGRTLEQPRDRRRHRIHGGHDAADVEGPPGEGLRVHRRVRAEEPARR